MIEEINMAKMRKITPKICATCKYSKCINRFKYDSYCDYLCMTHKLRNCEIGYCDKYESKKKK